MGIETQCRLCKSKELELFLDLGFNPPSDSFLTKEQMDEPETYFPLKVCLCRKCGHMQLNYTVPGDVLYCRNYPYDNSTSESFRRHFMDMSRHICNKFGFKKGLAVDIGSNVGVLLSGFKEMGMTVLGIDPASNLAEKANKRGVETIPKFFNSQLARELAGKRGKASVITATNVFAHIPNIDDFVDGIKIFLDDRGVFVFEVPYALTLVENMLYDTIYHEHLGYISVKPMIPFFKKFGMEIFDIEMVNTHGGSLRVFVGGAGKHGISSVIADYAKKEENAKLHTMERLKKFADDVKKHRQELMALLLDLKKKGKKIVGVGAPAKGNTLLNYCKIDKDILDYLTERAETKIGLYTPGTHIPIHHDDRLKDDDVDYALLLSWNLATEIMKNLDWFTRKGGKFIIPMPHPKIV